MTLLPWVEINNFRGISHLRYEPKQVNLLIGRNNSGKSTILEAIYAVLTGNGAQKDFGGSRSLNHYSINVHSDLSTISTENHNISLYRSLDAIPEDCLTNLSDVCNSLLTFKGKFSVDEFSQKQILDYFINEGFVSFVVYDGKVQKIYLNYSIKASHDDIKRDLHNILINSEMPEEELDDYIFFLLNLSFLSDRDVVPSGNINIINNQDKLYSRIATNPLDLIEQDTLVRELGLIPNVERLMEGGVVYRDGDETYFLPYAVHGTGFGILLSLISALRQCRDGVLLIEEPENHMHPGYLQVFVENLMLLAKKLNVQVFMTTHSYDLIEALSRYPMDAAEEDSILISNVVSRDGKHELYNYSPSDAQKTMNQLMIDLRGT